MARRVLSLHSSGAIALEQRVDLGYGGAIKIAHERVLQATRRDGEFQRVLVRRQRQHSIDQAAGEAIPAAHAIHNVGDVVVPADHELVRSFMQAAHPLCDALIDSRSEIAMAFISG